MALESLSSLTWMSFADGFWGEEKDFTVRFVWFHDEGRGRVDRYRLEIKEERINWLNLYFVSTRWSAEVE